MRLFRISRLLAVTAALAVGLAGTASATTYTTGDNALLLVGDTLQIRDSTDGTSADLDITLTAYDIGTATWTFIATVIGSSATSIQELGVSIIDECNFAPNINCLDSVGTNAGAGIDVTPPIIGGFTSLAVFSFDAGGNGLLDAGETSDEFFLSYGTPLLATTGILPESIVNFMINPLVGGDQNVTNRIIPEPSTALLLLSGVVGLAYTRRARTR